MTNNTTNDPNSHAKAVPLARISLLLWLFIQGQAWAQDQPLEITTLAEVRANGDIFVADNGDLFITDFGNPSIGNGNTVVQIKPDGSHSIYVSGLSNAASGITMDSNGNLYAATLNGGDVYRLPPNAAPVRINSGLSGPVGLTVDNNDNLYVVECGANRLSRLVNGGRQTVTVLPGVGCPNGVIWGHDNALYVVLFNDGRVYRVDTAGNTTLFADIPGAGSHIEFYDGHYYVSGRTTNQVYQIDLNGQVVSYAGTGVDGNTDGTIDVATISRPNGIGVDPNNGAVYVTGSSDFSRNNIPIRKIAPQTVEVNDFKINYGLAGSWYSQRTSGQGFLFDFVVTGERFDLLLYWFTYNDSAIDLATELSGFGSTQSRWFTALGPVEGAKVVMPIARTAGGVFDQATSVTSDAVGTIELEFFDCETAVLNYVFDVPEQKSGTIELQRLVPDILCETLAAES